MSDGFDRYLDAKRSLDDRSIDRYVLARLEHHLDRLRAGRGTRANAQRQLRVLEVGAGIGAMVERCWRWDLLPGNVRYTAVERDGRRVDAARDRIRSWAVDRGHAILESTDVDLVLVDEGRQFEVEFVADDALTFANGSADEFDLLIGHAFLDLVDLRTALTQFRSLLRPGGLCYLPITFDGETIFEPPVEPDVDERVVAAYHRTMDERVVDGEPAGHSRTGRALLTAIPEMGGEVLAAGSSDWVVHPRNGAYPTDEATVVSHVLDRIGVELGDHPDLDGDRVDAWVAARRGQLDRGELVYVAHQLDVLARFDTGHR